MTSVDRRRWLKSVVAGACALAGCGETSASSGDRRRTVIVGGGLAGLALLRKLVDRGDDAVLLEAGRRLGGRVYTLRDGPPSGLIAEAGAERVGVGHTRVRAWLERFGVACVPPTPPKEPFRLTLGAERHVIADTTEPPAALLEGLSETERRFGPFWIDIAFATAIEAPRADDPRSAMRWMKDAGLGARAESYVRAFCAHPLDRIPAVEYHRLAHEDLDAFDWSRIDGGSSRLTDAMSTGLDGFIRRDHVVDGVWLDGGVLTGGVAGKPAVRCRNGAVFVGDRVVLALPLEPLRKLAFHPERPVDLTRRLDGLFASDQVKIHVEIPPIGTGTFSPWNARSAYPRMTWLADGVAADGRRLMGTMATEVDLVAVRTLLAQGPAAVGAAIAASIPDFPTRTAAAWFHDFGRDPFAGGSGTYARRGDIPRGPVITGALGVVGSDLSDMPGWMEGALSSVDTLCDAWGI